jgi:hypothetical protein
MLTLHFSGLFKAVLQKKQTFLSSIQIFNKELNQKHKITNSQQRFTNVNLLSTLYV